MSESKYELRRKFLLLERLTEAARTLASVETWTRGRSMTWDECVEMDRILRSVATLATSMPSPRPGSSFVPEPAPPPPALGRIYAYEPSEVEKLQRQVDDLIRVLARNAR